MKSDVKVQDKKLSFFQSMFLVITMAFFILMSVLIWQVSIHLALFFEISVTIVFALFWGFDWQEVEEMLFSSFKNIGNVILILLLIGMLIGVWIAIGTVPSMIYYGLKVINPRYFLVLSFVLTSLVSMAVGTAIGTASTIGLALISIAQGLGLPLPLVAGAIISGCYVGDRMSPVSSIAIITAHSAGADIIDMIKRMVFTIIPPYIISLITYFFIGVNNFSTGGEKVDFTSLTAALNHNFVISYWMFLPPILIIFMALNRIPTILNFIINIFGSLLLGLIISNKTWTRLLHIMFRGFKADTGFEILDNILGRGGMTSMLELISLIIFAVILGGLFEKLGVLTGILSRLISFIDNKGQLVMMTMLSSIISAMLGCNQFLGVFLPARMMYEKYDQLRVSRAELARALGDSGLIVSPLIPWNVNALMMTAVLGVNTINYFKFAFLPLLVPLTGIFYGFLSKE